MHLNEIEVQMPLEMQQKQGYPDMLQQYHSLYPLDAENAHEQPSRAIGVQTTIFKGISVQDGSGFAIRRFAWREVTTLPLHTFHNVT